MLAKFREGKRYSNPMPMEDLMMIFYDVVRIVKSTYGNDPKLSIEVISPSEAEEISKEKGITTFPSTIITAIDLECNDANEILDITQVVRFNALGFDAMRTLWTDHPWMIAHMMRVLLLESFGRYLLMKDYIGLPSGKMSVELDIRSFNCDWYTSKFEDIINERIKNKKLYLVVGLTLADYAVIYANIHKFYEIDEAEDAFERAGLSKYLSYDDYYTMFQLFESRNYDDPEEVK